jgi:hypothetical protein
MPPSRRWLVAMLLVIALPLSACGKAAEGPAEEEEEAHAKVERIQGTKLSRVVLTPTAARSLGIRTQAVRAGRDDEGKRALVIPYSAIFYDSEGESFTYTNPSRLTYVRRRIVVDDIEHGRAVLVKGPPAGTAVVTVGTDELLGVEDGVQE